MRMITRSFFTVLFAANASTAATQAASSTSPTTFADLKGEVVLDNARVLVQRFVIAPGQSTGRQLHPADQLFVFIKGGLLTLHPSGRATLWREGRVAWQAGGAPSEEGSINGGTTPIEIICVTLKPVAASTQGGAVPADSGAPAAASAAAGEPKYRHLNYPNIPGEDLLENDLVIVQRFTVNPGQWEGVHGHHPDMLYIHVKGGQWAERTYAKPEPHAYPEASPDGEVGWMATIPESVGHQSGNIGKAPIDLIWVTLKK